jgi:hypothetical protein
MESGTGGRITLNWNLQKGDGMEWGGVVQTVAISCEQRNVPSGSINAYIFVSNRATYAFQESLSSKELGSSLRPENTLVTVLILTLLSAIYGMGTLKHFYGQYAYLLIMVKRLQPALHQRKNSSYSNNVRYITNYPIYAVTERRISPFIIS